MESNNKYYTPSIEEFHNGFEFEILDWVDNENHKGPKWIKTTYPDFIIGFRTDHLRVEELLKKIRVKYLDKDDFLDLGFKEYELDKNILFIEGKNRNFLIEPFYNYRQDIRETFVQIFEYNIFNPYPSKERPLYRGDILNKSELKKLMIRLEISGKK